MQNQILNKITSAILVDNDHTDCFVNKRILLKNGITNVVTFRNAHSALSYLIETGDKYQLIIVDVYLPIIDGFEFINKFKQLELDKKHGQIFLLSASFNQEDKNRSFNMGIKFIDKPLTVEKLLVYAY